MTPPVLVVCSFINHAKISARDQDFLKKWGSLYGEFKINKGFWSSQYYLVYFLRRLAYMLTQVYLNHSLFLQGALNIAFSTVQTAYLLYYMPFKEKSILVSNVLGEVVTLQVVVLTFTFLFGLSQSASQQIEQVVVLSIIGAIGVQMLISVYSVIKSSFYLWKKINKTRALNFAKAATKTTFPE